MKTSQILLGAGLLAGGLFMTTVHETQVQKIEEQDALISSLKDEKESHDQYVSELEETLSETQKELKRVLEHNERLIKANQTLNRQLDNMLELEGTGYTPYCSTGCIGITKSGHDVTKSREVAGMRVVAVDPTVIPLGTTMIVHTKDGSFEAIALDTGGAIKGYRIDILFLKKDRAWSFGRQSVIVEIIGHIPDYKSLV